jgi:hypothetical protein
MEKFIVDIQYSDGCTYCFTESLPLRATNLDEAESIVLSEVTKGVDDENLYPSIHDVRGVDIDDITVTPIEKWFEGS